MVGNHPSAIVSHNQRRATIGQAQYSMRYHACQPAGYPWQATCGISWRTSERAPRGELVGLDEDLSRKKRGDTAASPLHRGGRSRLGYDSHRPERLSLLTIFFPIHIMRLHVVFHPVRKIAQ